MNPEIKVFAEKVFGLSDKKRALEDKKSGLVNKPNSWEAYKTGAGFIYEQIEALDEEIFQIQSEIESLLNSFDPNLFPPVGYVIEGRGAFASFEVIGTTKDKRNSNWKVVLREVGSKTHTLQLYPTQLYKMFKGEF